VQGRSLRAVLLYLSSGIDNGSSYALGRISNSGCSTLSAQTVLTRREATAHASQNLSLWGYRFKQRGARLRLRPLHIMRRLAYMESIRNAGKRHVSPVGAASMITTSKLPFCGITIDIDER